MIDREAIAQQEADIDRDAAAEYWGNDNPPLELIAVCRRVRQAAYAAGMERAAEIGEEMFGFSSTIIVERIRAEKDKG